MGSSNSASHFENKASAIYYGCRNVDNAHLVCEIQVLGIKLVRNEEQSGTKMI